jgi:hypothetical protein
MAPGRPWDRQPDPVGGRHGERAARRARDRVDVALRCRTRRRCTCADGEVRTSKAPAELSSAGALVRSWGPPGDRSTRPAEQPHPRRWHRPGVPPSLQRCRLPVKSAQGRRRARGPACAPHQHRRPRHIDRQSDAAPFACQRYSARHDHRAAECRFARAAALRTRRQGTCSRSVALHASGSARRGSDRRGVTPARLSYWADSLTP